MSKKYIVRMKVTTEEPYEIIAKNADEAERIAMEKYCDGEFDLSENTETETQMKIEDEDNNALTDWFNL